VSLFAVTAVNSDRALLTDAELIAAIGGVQIAGDALTALSGRVTASIVRACRVAAAGTVPPTLRREAVSDTYRLKSEQVALVLSRRFAVLVASIVVNGDALVATDYEIDTSAGVLRRLCGEREVCWPCGKIVVSYEAGFETVPDDLKLAAVKLAGVLYSEGKKVDPGLKRERIDGLIEREWWVGPASDPAIPAEVMDLLRPYVSHWIG